MTRMITSDAITWNAPTDEHPARSASQRSYSAVAKGDLAEWLTVYAPDAVIEDPVGPSMFDPEGKGHHGHEGISAFWKLAIEPIDKFEFTINESFANPGSNTCANLGQHQDVVPRRQLHRHRPDHGLRRQRRRHGRLDEGLLGAGPHDGLVYKRTATPTGRSQSRSQLIASRPQGEA